MNDLLEIIWMNASFKIHSRRLSGETEKTTRNISKNSRLPARYLKLGFPEHQARLVTTKLLLVAAVFSDVTCLKFKYTWTTQCYATIYFIHNYLLHFFKTDFLFKLLKIDLVSIIRRILFICINFFCFKIGRSLLVLHDRLTVHVNT